MHCKLIEIFSAKITENGLIRGLKHSNSIMQQKRLTSKGSLFEDTLYVQGVPKKTDTKELSYSYNLNAWALPAKPTGA